MILPYGTSIKLECHRNSDIHSIDLSPDGRLFALVTTRALQVWSVGPSPVLLSSIPQKRPAACNKSLLRRESVFWSPDGSMICVVRGEGVAEFFRVTHGVRQLNTSYEEDDGPLEFPYCTIEALQRISIESCGLPTSAARGNNCLFIGTDSGYIHQLLWHGVINTLSLSTFFSSNPPLMTSGPLLSGQIVMSLDYNEKAGYMVVVLSNGSCLLLLPPMDLSTPLAFSDCLVVQEENASLCSIGRYRDIVAVANRNSTISCYDILIEDNKWSVNHAYNLSLKEYSGVNDEILLGVEVLRWSEHNDALAVGYNRRGLVVWNPQNTPVFMHMESMEEEVDVSSNQKPGVHALCWSRYSDLLLYGCPSEQVWKENGVTSLSWDGQLYAQPFVVCDNCCICTPSRGLWCRGASQIVHIYQDTIDVKKTYKHIYNLPPSFVRQNYPFQFVCSNVYGDKVCVGGDHGVAVMDQKTMQWFVYNNLFAAPARLTCLCWYKSDILLLCVRKLHGSYIYAYRCTDMTPDKCMQEINIDTEETLIDIQVQDTNIYILTNLQAILTFSITVVDDTRYTDVLPITSGNKFLLPEQCRYSSRLLPIPSSSSSLYLDPMSIYNINRPNESRDSSLNLSTILQENDIYTYEQNQICMIYSEDSTLDMINFTEGIHRRMYKEVQQVFISISPSDLPLKLRISVYVRRRTDSCFWYPLIDPSFDKTSALPIFSPMGYVYRNTPIYALPHLGCCVSNVNNVPIYMRKDALQLETHSIIHLLLWYLLNMNIFSISRYMLLYFYNHKIPHLSSSMEYLLHISLNSSKQSFLRHLLNLLSALPIFPRILMACLRKQERSTWPYVIRNREQSLKMFALFLKSRDMEFASISLALVQGLLCTVSEMYIGKMKEDKEEEEEKSSEEDKEELVEENCKDPEDIRKMDSTLHSIRSQSVFDYSNLHTTDEHHTSPSSSMCGLCVLESILNEDSSSGKENTESLMSSDCTAHLCGMRLLMVAIEEENYAIGTEAYRFIVMEEQRHEDEGMPIPQNKKVQTVLSRYCYYLLTRCKLAKILRILKLFPFKWTPYYDRESKYESGDIDIEDYYRMLLRVKEELRWSEQQLCGPPIQMVKDDVDSLPLIIEGQNQESGEMNAVSTEEVENLLYVLMKANAAQWSLLLMTLLMKTQKAALIAEARPDIWKQLKEDIVKNKDENFESFVRKVDDQVERIQKQKEELMKEI